MTSPAHVLMVCTGNICRSPSMHYLAQQLWGEAAEVTSAGTYAEIGMDATREMRKAAAAHGLTFPRHRPTQLTADLVERADLVLVATQSHARWIEREVGTMPTQVFGIRQAAELATRADAPHGDTPAERLGNAAMALMREHRRNPAPLRSLDDPWGHNQEVYERVMNEIAQDLEAITVWAGLR